MTVRWQFDDLTNSDHYDFEINPVEGGFPFWAKNITYQNTVAPGGNAIIFEGRDQVQTLTWTGTILTQAQHDIYVTWYNKRHQIQVTDDLGNIYMIYITKYTPTRKRAVHYPWKFSYTVEATILGLD